MPDVFDLSKDQAIAALRGAGYQGELGEASGRCGSVVNGRVIEIGHVCVQQPSPGSVQGARLPMRCASRTRIPGMATSAGSPSGT